MKAELQEANIKKKVMLMRMIQKSKKKINKCFLQLLVSFVFMLDLSDIK